MFYISRKVGNNYGVVDTKDNIEEFYTREQILDTVSKLKVSIKGVRENTVNVYAPKFDLDFTVNNAEFEDVINNIIAIDLSIKRNDKLFKFARQIYGNAIEDFSFGVEVRVEDNLPNYVSFEDEINGERFGYLLFYRSDDSINMYLPCNLSSIELNRLYSTIEKAKELAENKLIKKDNSFVYDGIAFKGKLGICDNKVYLKSNSSVSCRKETLLNYFKESFDERISSGAMDRDATLYEYLKDFDETWLKIYIERCHDYDVANGYSN